MRPIPETTAAVDEYGPFDLQQCDLIDRLTEITAEVRDLVPDCIGLSVTLRELDVTFTLVASESEVALLDAVQLLDGGPCVDANLPETVVSTSDDPLDEQRWQLLAVAKAARDIASTLSLPIVEADEVVVGGFNLYGASPRCFDDHHDELARVLGAWAGGAVTNADLTFGTREIARRASTVLRQGVELALVSGLLATKAGADPAGWEQRIRTAAARAGIPLVELVETLREALGPD